MAYIIGDHEKVSIIVWCGCLIVMMVNVLLEYTYVCMMLALCLMLLIMHNFEICITGRRTTYTFNRPPSAAHKLLLSIIMKSIYIDS